MAVTDNSVIFAGKTMDFLNIHAMAKYLDPKADLTFKKIFSNHPDLLISLLNSLLPLDADRQIESILDLKTTYVWGHR